MVYRCFLGLQTRGRGSLKDASFHTTKVLKDEIIATCNTVQSAVTCKGREWKGQFENVCKVNYIGYNSALHFKSTKLQQEQEFGKFHKNESTLQNHD